jgi:hypothetical protein
MGQLSREEIAAFCIAWRDAEDSLKAVEGELLQLPQQPINELRYATRHFIRAIEADDAAECRTQYDAAIRHCTCASYDTAEAVLLFRALRFKLFREDFKDFPIETPVLDYKAALVAYRGAQDALSRNPEDRHHRKTHVQAAVASLDVFDKSLDDARDELNKAVAKDRRTRNQWLLGFAALVVAAIAACGQAYAAIVRADKQQALPTAVPSAHPPKLQP